ncbi:class I SAM-dependent RNA methyltransferase [Dongia rigui]|uniref:Class I SAM-dependent RNA methyltransferase n=1 Tax=Dongia rigui TaxID=940149 RepID=A0ABU5DW53_9PROT|nr:TRAM domain-containing protein [Dongia rigui]MDY0871527.1 class I SAM-dependent RNA methyltransferase [Dongia rigui]
MSEPLTVELAIEALGAQGDGIGHHHGATVFVPYALPGDRVRVRLQEKGKNAFAGRLIEVLQPAPGRVVPPCPVFTQCGGCAMQHLSLADYAAWKKAQVAATLATRGIPLPEKTECVGTEPGARRRAVFAAHKEKDQVTLGFHAVMSHEIVPLDDCLLLTAALRAGLPSLHALAAAALHNKQSADLQVTETLSGLDILMQSGDALPEARRQPLIAAARAADFARVSWAHGKRQPEPIVMARVPQVRFADVVVDLPIGGFLQPSLSGEAALVAAVNKGVGKAKRVADLFGGCGTFSFPLAQQARVLSVDSARPATAALVAAVNRAQLSGRVEGLTRDLEQSPLPPQDLKPFDAVVFDPPRAGAEMQSKMIAKSIVKRAVAVSCNPASFARDARILIDAGFAMTSLVILDQFLWSHHAELVAVFTRK